MYIVDNTIVGGFGISISMGFPGDLGGIVSGNDVSGSSGAGISLSGSATETLRPISFTNNTVHDNAGDGIGVTMASNDYFVQPGGDNGPIELRGNVARRNGGRGINAAFSRDGGSGPGVIDRGANRASGNAITPQCVGVRCGPTDPRLIPDVTWHNPAQLDPLVPLSSAQLNATSPVPGTFTYTPAVGTVPLGGPTALRVHFVPDDLVHYQPTDRTVELLVPASPVVPVITWPTPDPIVYGTPLGPAQLDATAPVPGTFTYTPAAGTVLTVGSHQLHVRFVPDDRILYRPADVDTTITVLPPAAQSVTWSDPAPIPYGTPVGPTQLNAVSSVPGSFTYTPAAGTVFMPGQHALIADFTPDDTTTYSPIQTVVQIDVLPPTDAPPTATFAPALDIPRGGFDAPLDVDLADVNGDGFLDTITTTPGLGGLIPGAANVRISFGAGDGSFPTSGDVIIPLSDSGHTVAAGDIDGDGHVDLVATNGTTSTISVILGHGDGTFAPKVDRPAGNGQGDIQLVDMNGDGALDVVESNFTTGTVSVLLGHGDGTFADPVDARAGALPVKFAAADVNGDGHLDLVVPDALTNIVSVLLGNGDGTFQARRTVPVGLTPTSVAAADLDGDGHLDLAVTNAGDSTVSVLMGDGTGAFGGPRLDYQSATGPRAVRAADMNGDGVVDLVTVNDSGTIGVWLGAGDGSLHPRIDREIGPEGSALALGDLDGDGQLDLVVARLFQLKVTVVLNRTLPPSS